MDTPDPSPWTAQSPPLLASSNDIYRCSVAESHRRERQQAFPRQDEQASKQADDGGEEPAHKAAAAVEKYGDGNYFTSAQWVDDGSCLITTNADHSIRTFIAPEDLLEAREVPHTLSPYSVIPSSEPVSAVAPYPFFNLADSTTAVILSSVRDLPIRLSNIYHYEHLAFDRRADEPSPPHSSTIVQSYSLITTTTEKHLTPASLLWSDSTHFLTGTDSLICLFDVARRTPVSRLPTIPSKRHKLKGGGVGMRGIVSALSLQPSADASAALLAAGTWTRCVALYDAAGLGGTVATWDVRAAADREARIGGGGVSQVRWSACGRYLVVAERRSRGLLVYDVRVAHRLVGWLEGRRAETNQRMGVDVFAAQAGMDGPEDGSEVWAGGSDGCVRAWKRVGMTEGAQPPDLEWAAHDDVVSSVAVHHTGLVVASCSGQRRPAGSSESESSQEDDESSASYDSSERLVEPSHAVDTAALDRHIEREMYGDNSLKIWGL